MWLDEVGELARIDTSWQTGLTQSQIDDGIAWFKAYMAQQYSLGKEGLALFYRNWVRFEQAHP